MARATVLYTLRKESTWKPFLTNAIHPSKASLDVNGLLRAAFTWEKLRFALIPARQVTQVEVQPLSEAVLVQESVALPQVEAAESVCMMASSGWPQRASASSPSIVSSTTSSLWWVLPASQAPMWHWWSGERQLSQSGSSTDSHCLGQSPCCTPGWTLFAKLIILIIPNYNDYFDYALSLKFYNLIPKVDSEW